MNIHKCLKKNRIYVVEIPYHTFTRHQGNRYTAFGKGIYRGEYGKGKHYYLWDVTVYLRGTHITFTRDDVDYLGALLLDSNDIYDLEEIRDKSRKARQTMEHRSLNMILKRLVNEHFEW